MPSQLDAAIPTVISHRFQIKCVFADGGSSAKTLLVTRAGRDQVLKYATWDGIGSSGIPWLRAQAARLLELKQALPPDAALSVPEVFETYDTDDLFLYSMQYYPGSHSMSVYYFDRPAEALVGYADDIVRLLTLMSENLYSAGRLPVPDNYIEHVHLDKIVYRLSYLTKSSGRFFDTYLATTTLPETFAALLDAPSITTNGQRYVNAPALIDRLRHSSHVAALTPAFLPLYAHGDGTLRNYLKLPGQRFALIDARGTNLPGDAPSRTCISYELGKVLRTFYLEIVRRNAFQLTRDHHHHFQLTFDNTPAVKAFEEIRRGIIEALPRHQALSAVLADEPQWLEKALFAEACHFLADASNRLESDPTGQQTLAYYLIGTQMLNDYCKRNGILT